MKLIARMVEGASYGGLRERARGMHKRVRNFGVQIDEYD